MPWTIEFERDAAKQLRNLDKPLKKRVENYLDEVVQLPDPRMRGSGLQGDKKGFWRYRIGDIRALCEIHNGELVVLVLKVSKRETAYD